MSPQNVRGKGVPASGDVPEEAGHLPADAVVVRGGVMGREGLIRSARKYADQNEGVYGITVWSWPSLTAGEIAQRVKNMYPPGKNPVGHRQLRQSTAGMVRDESPDGRAFTLNKTGPDGHYTLTFPSEPTDGDWERLESMFARPEPNPASE